MTHNALIVEDLDFWQAAIREVLIDAGYDVCVTASYAAALDALSRQPFDLAVIDPVLDDTNRHNRDGLRVLQHILAQYPAMHAVITTSSDPNRIRREVNDLSPAVPILWKDAWDDEDFLALIQELGGAKGSDSYA